MNKKLEAPKKVEIPAHLLRSKYWGALIYMFQNHPKLNRYFNTGYFDLQGETVSVSKLKKVAIPWSETEKFMLAFTLHLFNVRYKLPSDGLSTMDSLDANNRRMCMTALSIRFGGAPLPAGKGA